jgi:hypothetical protein
MWMLQAWNIWMEGKANDLVDKCIAEKSLVEKPYFASTWAFCVFRKILTIEPFVFSCVQLGERMHNTTKPKPPCIFRAKK